MYPRMLRAFRKLSVPVRPYPAPIIFKGAIVCCCISKSEDNECVCKVRTDHNQIEDLSYLYEIGSFEREGSCM